MGALLRREGLYSSLLTTWRRERDAVVLRAFAPQNRGPKSKRDPVAEENQQLRRETLQLKEALRKAEIVIDIQKKVAALLGRPSRPSSRRRRRDGRRPAALLDGRHRVCL